MEFPFTLPIFQDQMNPHSLFLFRLRFFSLVLPRPVQWLPLLTSLLKIPTSSINDSVISNDKEEGPQPERDQSVIVPTV